jgi:hypothetical protein
MKSKIKDSLEKELIERGKKQRYLTYEHVMEFGELNNLSEKEVNELIQNIEKNHIELVMQEELENKHIGDIADFHEDDEKISKIKTKLKTNIEVHESEVDEDEREENEPKDISSTAQITDGVKCYLRDIGKIPLLNKKNLRIH